MLKIYQQKFPYSVEELEALDACLSLERISTYHQWASNDREKTYFLYALNSALSEALYTPLQMLEITLRNSFHTALTNTFGEMWFDEPNVITRPDQLEKISDAKAELEKNGKAIAAGRVVAELTFGFWTGLLSPDYENTLYRRCLAGAFAHREPSRPKRKDITRTLTPIRVLRNRIAHHEPILSWDLPKHHGNIEMITSWMSPTAAKWSQDHSRFTQVYPDKPIELDRSDKLNLSSSV